MSSCEEPNSITKAAFSTFTPLALPSRGAGKRPFGLPVSLLGAGLAPLGGQDEPISGPPSARLPA